MTMTGWENVKWFFKPETLPQFRATLRYLEMSSEWVECIYGKKLDRGDIEAVKRILAQIDGQPSDRVPPAA